MVSRLHDEKHASKLLEVDAFHGTERVLDEERDDALEQMLRVSHAVGQSIVVVLSNHAAIEECPQRMQELHIALVLHDGEFRQNLMATFHVGMLIDPDVKATFTIHEACDPLRFQFHRQIPNVKSLRVSRAIEIFPADCPHVRPILTDRGERSSTERLFEEFPAYGSVLLGLAKTNLRTVIVTAAVYRGFSSELWLAPDPSL